VQAESLYALTTKTNGQESDLNHAAVKLLEKRQRRSKIYRKAV
jgi:hypothetical protein